MAKTLKIQLRKSSSVLRFWCFVCSEVRTGPKRCAQCKRIDELAHWLDEVRFHC